MTQNLSDHEFEIWLRIVACAARRDRAVSQGRHETAAVWAGFLEALYTLRDRDRRMAAAVNDAMCPVEPMTPEEVAEVWPEDVGGP